jgi:soluble lytic murein transglycosylase
MIGTSLAAALALLAPAPESLIPTQVPYTSVAPGAGGSEPRVLSPNDTALFREGLALARARDIPGTRAVMSRISDPAARKLVEWALLDTSAERMSWSELADVNARFANWPRSESRRAAVERALERGYPGADETLAVFARASPITVEGAIVLAGALEQLGRHDEARQLIRDWWTTRSFDEGSQTRILARWGSILSQSDHEARLNVLLLGPHGPATRAMTQLVSPERRAVAEAAMALRTAYDADSVIAGLPPALARDPAVALERVRILRAAGRQSEGFGLLSALPAAGSAAAEAQNTLWSERRNYFLDALQVRNWQAAYDAMAGHGFPSGERKVDAEFFAGWVALTKLNDPRRAADHFETLRQASSTPITQGRALYWLGRAAEAQGNTPAAVAHYQGGAQHIQTFYGQLAAEKAGQTRLVLPPEPAPTAADRTAFEADERVRALRVLGEAGETSLLRVFAYQLDDDLPPAQLALLMDAVRGYGEGFTAMMVGRAASQRGILMPERQYPIRIPPAVAGAAPLEFTLAITRQESSFDPRARSTADARGMMQFLPSTAAGVARRLGMPYSDERLWDPDYNMTLGSYHLGELMTRFGGSMLLTTVGYNAGPARPPQWIARCGDPRGGQVDPVDFIECAPFTETRNYMMRVMENMGVYKARLNGGSAPLTLSQDLRRGAASGPRPYAEVGGDPGLRVPPAELSE